MQIAGILSLFSRSHSVSVELFTGTLFSIIVLNLSIRVNLKLPHFQQQGHKKPEGKNQKKLYFIEIFPEENSINYLEELDPTIKGAPYEEIANISSINVLQTQEADDNSRFSANNRTLNKSAISGISKRDYQQSPRAQQPRRIVHVISNDFYSP